MPSILPGYEYDIFISYRQNDNKRDRWVTEFINTLQDELEATVKGKISIYFDENPFDGLGETHDVDDSLAKKLKCLIFIPIISKTYCDPNSFAWTNEFIAFNELAGNDEYGLKITLPNGNTASRVLPIRIHEISDEDKKLVEDEIGFLRSIDFVYQSAGVNRPLSPSDDPNKNLNKSLYKDQINKVANAIQDIISGLKAVDSQTSEDQPQDESASSRPKKIGITSEIKRRNVARASLVYILAGLLMWKVAGVVGVPDNIMALVPLVLIILFPMAVLMAWLYERSPQGFIRAGSLASRDNPFTDAQKKPLTSNVFIILLVATVAALFVIYPQNDSQTATASEVIDKSIAVLPFKDMSQGGDQQYFADGVMESILNHLAKIKDLRVISRNTMEVYRASNKSTPAIAREVGVSYVLEGSVQKFDEDIRITVQLIEGSTDKHLWSDNFDREMKDIFAIQTEIAKTVAKQLKLNMTASERTTIESVPTASLTAYDFYLRGWEYGFFEDKYAMQMFKKAVEIDPNFTIAWLGLASVSRIIYFQHIDRSDENFANIKVYLDRAIALEPELFEVQLETGIYYYHCKMEYDKALKIFDELKSNYPLNASLNMWTGTVYRRMGEFELSLEYMEKALVLDPSAYFMWNNTAGTLRILGKYKQAEEYYKTVLDLAPSQTRRHSLLVELFMASGQLEKANAWLNEHSGVDDEYIYPARSMYELNTNRNYQEAINILETSPYRLIDDQYEYTLYSMQIALVYNMMRDVVNANKYFKEALEVLQSKMIELRNDSRLYSSLGITYAGLGMKQEALAANETALSIINISVDAWRGFYRELDMARILLMVGDHNKAIAKLDFLLQQNKLLTVELLKTDPFWDPIRNYPAFTAIIENPDYQIDLGQD